MDDLEKLLSEFNTLIRDDIVAFAKEHGGELTLTMNEISLFLISNAILFATNTGATKENIKAVCENCIGELKEAKASPKIIC